MKKRFVVLTIYFVAALFGALALGQSPTPDRRGEVVLDRPEYKGIKANAPIPTNLHIRNEGGSDGAGLCVISSILANGRYQHVPGLEGGKDSNLWRTAKGRRGGYGPDKLANLVNEVMPGEKWASYVGRDTSILDKLSAEGYPIGSTMNTGALYGYSPIHHMISLTHYSKRDGYACVVDNNDPGKYHWMPTSEYDRRWIDGGIGWAWIWLRKPGNLARVAVVVFASTLFIGGGFILLTVAAALRLEPSDYAHG